MHIMTLIPVSDIYWDDGRRAGMKNEIRVRPWWSLHPFNQLQTPVQVSYIWNSKYLIFGICYLLFDIANFNLHWYIWLYLNSSSLVTSSYSLRILSLQPWSWLQVSCFCLLNANNFCVILLNSKHINAFEPFKLIMLFMKRWVIFALLLKKNTKEYF